MKFFALLLSTLSMMGATAPAFAESTNAALYAVRFHADWCGKCKAIDAKLMEARQQHDLDNSDVLFIRFDLTNDTTKHQAQMKASALGLSDLYTKNNGTTGQLTLVDAKTGKVLEMLTHQAAMGEIAAVIKEKAAMAASS